LTELLKNTKTLQKKENKNIKEKATKSSSKRLTNS